MHSKHGEHMSKQQRPTLVLIKWNYASICHYHLGIDNPTDFDAINKIKSIDNSSQEEFSFELWLIFINVLTYDQIDHVHKMIQTSSSFFENGITKNNNENSF